MAAPAPVPMPAARLRKGDVLPAYGPEATVARHPVISVDGAIVNVLISNPASSASEQANTGLSAPTLARMPVGLCVDVIRSRGDQTPFVRSAKVAKSSGARIAVLDLSHPDAEIAAEAGEKFATLCTVHHALKTHAGISTAQAQATHPEQWCDGCAKAAMDIARQRVWGAAPVSDATGGATA